MANVTDTRMGEEEQVQDTWFPAMDPITIEEVCELKPKSWSSFHGEVNTTPVSTQGTTPEFNPKRVRDSISVYKDRESRSPHHVSSRKPNGLQTLTITKDQESEKSSTSLKSHSIYSRASTVSKTFVKKVAKSFCVFMLCTPPDDYIAPPPRVISLSTASSKAAKIKHGFWTFVDGESRYPAPAPALATPATSKAGLQSNIATTVSHDPTTTKIEGPDPTNTPTTYRSAPEKIPIFYTNPWSLP